MKPKIRIVDNQFNHCGNGLGSFGTGDLGRRPSHFDWHRGQRISDIVVVTENSFGLVDSLTEPIKIALIIEPPSINPHSYEWIRSNHAKFTNVLTYNEDLLKSIPNGVKYIFGGCWINPEDQAVHEKTRGVSIIASDKTHTIGHKLRHDVIRTFAPKITGIYGRGYQTVNNKIEALKDYRYSIAIENEDSDVWITEKIIDCFMTGTIPIYYGTERISDNFNMDGVLRFTTSYELEHYLKVATDGFYNHRLHAINHNFAIAQKYVIPEDLIWRNFFCTLNIYKK